MKSVIKSFGALAILAATAMPFSAAQANCTVIQKLVNDGTLEQSSTLQVGGQQAVQAILMNQALCRKVTQELINNGVLTQSGTLQVGGLQAIQLLVIGTE